MQPYFLPYIGYFQLIAEADMFVIYDNIKYTKKGWINRNRMLINGADAMFSLPLQHDSDKLDVVERKLAADFNRDKLLNQFKGAYARAPYFSQIWPLIEHIVRYEERNLFRYIQHSVVSICCHLGLETRIRIASDIGIDHGLQGQDKVIALCEALGADSYVNPIGGVGLYSGDAFRARGVRLEFIQSKPFEYPQLGSTFVPWLSIADVLMFNSLDAVREQVMHGYELI